MFTYGVIVCAMSRAKPYDFPDARDVFGDEFMRDVAFIVRVYDRNVALNRVSDDIGSSIWSMARDYPRDRYYSSFGDAPSPCEVTLSPRSALQIPHARARIISCEIKTLRMIIAREMRAVINICEMAREAERHERESVASCRLSTLRESDDSSAENEDCQRVDDDSTVEYSARVECTPDADEHRRQDEGCDDLDDILPCPMCAMRSDVTSSAEHVIHISRHPHAINRGDDAATSASARADDSEA
jgi:hypothetical protein